MAAANQNDKHTKKQEKHTYNYDRKKRRRKNTTNYKLKT